MNNLTIYFENKTITFQSKYRGIRIDEKELTVVSADITEKNIRQTIEWFLKQKACTRLIFQTDKTEIAKKNFLKKYKCINAAGGFITCKQGALFIFRNKKWDLPKGKLDKGESTAAAALRECEEECGINHLKIKKQLPESFHFYKLKGKMYLKRTYWFEMTTLANQKLTPQKEEGITQLKWFAKKDLRKPLQNTYPSIKDVLHNVKWI